MVTVLAQYIFGILLTQNYPHINFTTVTLPVLSVQISAEVQFVLCPRQDDVDPAAATDAQSLPTSCVHANVLEVIFFSQSLRCTGVCVSALSSQKLPHRLHLHRTSHAYHNICPRRGIGQHTIRTIYATINLSQLTASVVLHNLRSGDDVAPQIIVKTIRAHAQSQNWLQVAFASDRIRA